MVGRIRDYLVWARSFKYTPWLVVSDSLSLLWFCKERTWLVVSDSLFLVRFCQNWPCSMLSDTLFLAWFCKDRSWSVVSDSLFLVWPCKIRPYRWCQIIFFFWSDLRETGHSRWCQIVYFCSDLLNISRGRMCYILSWVVQRTNNSLSHINDDLYTRQWFPKCAVVEDIWWVSRNSYDKNLKYYYGFLIIATMSPNINSYK